MSANNEFAFPTSSIDGFTQHGMHLRDYFAGQVLLGMFAANSPSDIWRDAIQGGMPVDQGTASVDRCISQSAYRVADAMLEARADIKGDG